MAPKRKTNEYYINNGIAYVSLNFNKTMICDAEDWENQKHVTWFCDGGYAKTICCGKKMKFHREIMNPPADMEVDHINHNPLDNRRDNLRIVSHIVNMANRGRQANNKTGMNGVFYMKSNGRYYAQINVNGKRKYLGCYRDIEDAKAARIRAEYLYLIPFIEENMEVI